MPSKIRVPVRRLTPADLARHQVMEKHFQRAQQLEAEAQDLYAASRVWIRELMGRYEITPDEQITPDGKITKKEG